MVPGAICYLTPQREVTSLYAKFIKHIADIHSMALLRVDVPHSLNKTLQPRIAYERSTYPVE